MKSARSNKRWKLIAIVGIVVLAVAIFFGVQMGKGQPEPGAHLNVVAMKGPTGIGLASLIDATAQQEADGAVAAGAGGDVAGAAADGAAGGVANGSAGDSSLYTFTIETAADAVAALLAKGDADIALVPANLAATLYKKTQGQIQVIDINTLGVLYAVAQDETCTSMQSLRGKTVYMTGKGTVPEYTVLALLEAAGMSAADLTLEFKSEAAEVLAALQAHPDAVGILPQPFATAAVVKNAKLKTVMNLTEQWDALMGSDAGRLITGVTVARRSVIEQYPQAIEKFLADHKASVEAIHALDESAVNAVVELGIIDNAAIAKKAIPLCSTVFVRGAEMKSALSGYLKTLFSVNPAAIGGTLPDDNFYYKAG